MSLALMVAWALAATASPAPADHASAWADSQIIVVEVPESSLATPTASPLPSPSQTPAVTPAVADPGTRGPLPATGVDAAALLLASALGAAALAGGVVLRRRRRHRA